MGEPQLLMGLRQNLPLSVRHPQSFWFGETKLWTSSVSLLKKKKKKSIGNAIVSILRGRRPLLRPSLNILFILIFVSMCMTVHVSECTHVCVCVHVGGRKSVSKAIPQVLSTLR